MIIQQKEPEFPGEVDFRLGQRTHKMILEQLVVSESKEVIKKKKDGTIFQNKNWNVGIDLKELQIAKSVMI